MDFFNFLFRNTMWGQIANQMNMLYEDNNVLGQMQLQGWNTLITRDLHARTYGNLSA